MQGNKTLAVQFAFLSWNIIKCKVDPVRNFEVKPETADTEVALIVISKPILEMIVLQHLARSLVAHDKQSVIIERRPAQEPNWAVASPDPIVQMIVADLQIEYALDEPASVPEANKQPKQIEEQE